MEIPDSELRERLLALGYVPPPITSTSRSILIKKLKALETGTPMEPTNVIKDSEESENEKDLLPAEHNRGNLRQRLVKTEFHPVNIGMYSKCFVRTIDFWDRIGAIGTFFVLLFASVAVFFVFKFIGDWSDQRYRSIHLIDGVFPKCSQGGTPRITCIPDAELKFTESNLNVLRAALHHATVSERCTHAALKSTDFIGLYPLFKDNFLRNLLTKKLAFTVEESENLLENSKVLFKANPRLEVKVLKDGLLYRNQRLLRSCGLTGWNTVAYSYALYFLTSFAIVWFFYKFNRWVNKLRSESSDEKRRLIKDISDLIKQNEKQRGQNFLPVDEVREWLNSAVQLSENLWSDVQIYLREYESCISLEKKIVEGRECDVFSLKI